MKLLCVSILWTLVTAADSNHTVDAATVMTPAQNDTTTRQPEWLFMTRLVALVASAVVIRLVWSRIVSASKGSRGEEKHGKAAETEENRASSRSHAPIRETYIGLSPRSYDRTGQNPIGRNPNGRNPIGQNHVRQNPIGQNPNGRNPIGQNHVGQNPIGQNPNIQNPVGQNHVGQNPVGQNPVGQSPIGQNPIWRNLARGCCYSDTSSIDTSRHIYDNDPV